MTKEKCRICGTALEDDLFSFVTGELVCSVCQVKFIGGLSASQVRIDEARKKLGLAEGEYLNLP